MSKLNQKQSGFTIVELLLAMTFFSFILIFFSYGFIQISRTFQRGQTIKRVTQSGRAVMEDLSRNIRTSSSDPTSGYELLQIDGGPTVAAQNRLCLSSGVDYGWNEPDDPQETLLPAGTEAFSLVKSEATRASCVQGFTQFDAPVVVNAGGSSEYQTQGITSLLDDDMIVQNLEFTEVAGGNALRIDLTISVDNVGSLSGTGTTAVCDGFIGNGDEYCDVVRFSTIVGFRL